MAMVDISERKEVKRKPKKELKEKTIDDLKNEVDVILVDFHHNLNIVKEMLQKNKVA